MTALLQPTSRFDKIVEPGQDFEEFRPEAESAISAREDAKDMLPLVASAVKLRDLDLWRDIRFVEQKMKEHQALYDPHRDIFRSDQDIERIYASFQIWGRDIAPAAKRIVAGLKRRRKFG